MVAMVTIVINHVTGVYLIPVTKNMVSVQIHLDVNLDGNMDRQSVIYVCSRLIITSEQQTKTDECMNYKQLIKLKYESSEKLQNARLDRKKT
jgi:hypothetical protein